MPYKSKAQQRFMFAAEERGDVPKGTAREWAHKTPNIKKLPEKVKHKKTASDIAEAAIATCSAMRDFYEGAKWAPGGIEYQGPFKIASDLGTRQQHAQWHAQNDPPGTPPIDPTGQMTPERAQRAALLFHMLNANKQAAELPTNVADRAPSAIGSIIGAPKMEQPKLPAMPNLPKPMKVKKTAAEIAEMVMRKVATTGR
jgi:hypothetical protein